MDKEDIAYIHNGKYSAIKDNEGMPFAATWTDLEIIVLSEVSQAEKDKYHMLSLTQTHRHRRQACGYQKGKGMGKE